MITFRFRPTSLARVMVVAGSIVLSACQMSNSGAANGTSDSNAPQQQRATVQTVAIGSKEPTNASATCKLDIVSGAHAERQVTLSRTGDATFEGWAYAENHPALPTPSLEFHSGANQFAAPVTTGVLRNDVAEGLHNESLSHAGFTVTVDLHNLPPGDYALTLRSDDGGFRANCDLGTTVTVTN